MFLVISTIPYIHNLIIQPSEVQKFEITNLGELKMNDTNKQPPQGQNQAPQGQNLKPSPPPSRSIRESVELPAKK
ncbi:MAG: hypothetical protein QM520_01190 [Gammaproteobacteria bacterium]|nr:hypothetical protein [Gammaproteobacteria bacterium]